MTISQLDVLRGAQFPRIESAPPSLTSAGREAVELAAFAGLHLDPWQQHVLDVSLGEKADGRWSAFEVGLVVARQNGKGGVIEARELAGLFLFGERLIIHSAHLFDTAKDALGRLWALIEQTPDLLAKVKPGRDGPAPMWSHGEEGITLKNGQRIRFKTRTKGGGRGLSADCVILDEAMILPDSVMAALMPTMRAKPNPQLWYTGSAVDQETHEYGHTLAGIRRRGLLGDPSLAYLEWSAGEWADFLRGRIDTSDRDLWAMSNPGMGFRVEAEHMAREYASLPSRSFAVELLSIGDWPLPVESEHVVDPAAWKAAEDRTSQIVGNLAFAIDMDPGRSRVAIGVAGKRHDGLTHGELVDFALGSGWVPARMVELRARHGAFPLLIDSRSPAMSLVPALEAVGFVVTIVGATQNAQACGNLVDSIPREFRHLGQSELTDALRGAGKRDIGDGFGWSRKGGTNIAPLVAVTLATYGVATRSPDSQYEDRGLVVL